MAKSLKTYLFCFDDHRGFSEEVKKRFSDITRYTVVISHNRDELIDQLIREKEHNFCKVAIIGLHDTKENFEMADHLISDIKAIDLSTGIILLAPADKIDEVKKTVRLNIDSYIPRNSNAILRIHNTVKKLISEHSLHIYRKRRNFSLYIFLIFILLAIIFALIARFELPGSF